jgi:hypothetical protein
VSQGRNTAPLYGIPSHAQARVVDARTGCSKVVADSMDHDVRVNLNVYTKTSIDSRLEVVQALESAFCELNCGTAATFDGRLLNH